MTLKQLTTDTKLHATEDRAMDSRPVTEMDTHAQTFGAEQRLLLCCSRTSIDAVTSERLDGLLREPLDWNYLLEISQWHGVLPLLYWNLKDSRAELVPPEYLKELRGRFQSNVARNILLTGELSRIVKLFTSEGVDVIPYKGPALAVAAYGHLSLRRFVDLDIMVRKRDVLRAKELLIALGYNANPPLTQTQEAIMLRTQHNLPFARDEGRVLVELHWEVTAKKFSSAFDPERMWTRLETVTLGGETFKTLAKQDLLLALCVHGTKHCWGRLAWISDIAELCAPQHEIDWPQVVAEASTTGEERMLYLGLHLAQTLLGARLPDEIRSTAAVDPHVLSLARDVHGRLFAAPGAAPGMLADIRFHMRARKRLRGKLSYFRHIFMPTDADLTALRLPASLSFIYYLLRPFRLLVK